MDYTCFVEQARELFLTPEVSDPETVDCTYKEPDEAKCVSLLTLGTLMILPDVVHTPHTVLAHTIVLRI